MNIKKLMFLMLVFVISLSLIACGGGSSQEAGGETQDPSESESGEESSVVLRVSSAWAEGNSLLFNFDDFAQKVDEKSNGTVKIEWGGGPEAIPTYQLVEALKNGIVDIAWTAHTYNVSNIPVLEAMKLTDAATMRETGGFEFVNDIYNEKLNSHYIAASTDGLTYNLYTKDEINSLSDFEGMTIRATPAYQPFVESLGAGVVNMDPGEAYQALERNVIQGYGWPSVGVTDFGWQEVSEYIIQPQFYTVDVAIMMSDKAWQKLSDNQRDAIMEAGAEIEEEAREYYKEAIDEENEFLKSEGMKEIVLEGEEAEEYLKLAYEEGWKSALEADPENAEKLQEYTEYNQ
ncbi:TRAP transporter substrate-binding protein DctP [Gudongella sp. DL1XJH-153]|uniref:TRAP transporter substrate-binding protein DctP n=1 Tax=Gudongella sp. DL1XJH-153 TaxID=3409804 RepID=UPI003BB69172